jgi:hypothetical protein
MEQFFCTDNENQLNDYVYPHLKGNAIVKSAFLAGYLQPDCLDNQQGDTQKIMNDNSQEKSGKLLEEGEEEGADRGNI